MSDDTIRRDDEVVRTDNTVVRDDGIQHGIDDDPNNDAEKGAALGGIGGAVTGAVAGSAVGPAGTVVGALVGGAAGAVASGLAVGAVDRVDNDNNISGVGHEPRTDVDTDVDDNTMYDNDYRTHWNTNYASYGGTYDDYAPAYRYGYSMYNDPRWRGRNWDEIEPEVRRDWETRYPGNSWDRFKGSIRYGWDKMTGAERGGIKTGGYAADGTPDTRGIMEKTADTITGDNIDDKTGKRVY